MTGTPSSGSIAPALATAIAGISVAVGARPLSGSTGPSPSPGRPLPSARSSGSTAPGGIGTVTGIRHSRRQAALRLDRSGRLGHALDVRIRRAPVIPAELLQAIERAVQLAVAIELVPLHPVSLRRRVQRQPTGQLRPVDRLALLAAASSSSSRAVSSSTNRRSAAAVPARSADSPSVNWSRS